MYVTLNISATSIRILSVKGRQVKKWGSMPLPPGLVRDGHILDPKAVGAAINALFKSTGVPKKRVIASLTGLSFAYRILSLPRMKPAHLAEAIERAARKEIPLPRDEIYLSWRAIGHGHDELDFFVSGVPRKPIDALVQTLAEAVVKPYLIDVKPLALARAANREDALIVALEPDCFDIVLVANGIPAIMHTITPKAGEASLEDNIRRLTDELSKTVQFYNSSHPENPFSPTAPLLLTGELSTDPAASNLIQAEIEYQVESLVPPLAFPPHLLAAVYSTNIGLALKRVPYKASPDFRDININILSGIYRAKTRPIPLRYIIIPLALIMAIALLFPLYQVKSQADAETLRLQTELSEVGQELRQANLALSEAKQIEDTINRTVADKETLEWEHQHILSKRDDFAHNLELVNHALPSEAYFTSIEVGTGQITVEGEADNPFTVLIYTTALEGQGSFSEVRIAGIDNSEESTGVSFSIVISK